MVREVVESRWGRRLRRRSCATNQPLGPWCVLRAVGEAVPELGQLLWVTPASWLVAPKRRRRGRRASLSLSLREGTVGATRRWWNRWPVPTVGVQLPHHRRRSLVPGPRGSGKGRISVLDPKLLRSFPATPFPKSLGGVMIGDIFACHLTAKL